jgi:uncharacterized protein (TIGR02246 family)
MGPDERAIREVHTVWIDAVNAGDLPRLLSLMADDVVFLNPGKPPFGRDGFPAGFTDAHRQYRLQCVSELEEVVVVAGEMAFARSRDAVTIVPRTGGDAVRFAGDRLTIYRKHSDGRWLLARDAHTVTPAGDANS